MHSFVPTSGSNPSFFSGGWLLPMADAPLAAIIATSLTIGLSTATSGLGKVVDPDSGTSLW